MGHGAMSGVYPEVGDLALLTRAASRDYEGRRVWYRVLGVERSTRQGWVYLHGYEVDETERTLRSVFVRIEGLVIRRD